MLQYITYIFVMLLICVLFFSCARKLSGEKKIDYEVDSQENLEKVMLPIFSKDSAYRYVEEQLSFGPRIPNSQAHSKCKEYLFSKLRSYAEKVEQQDFEAIRWDGQKMNGTNIIASFGSERENRIFFCAHWDSRPYADMEEDKEKQKEAILGASDGASGVAVLLELSRLLYQKNPNIGVDIILLDLEDSGTPRFETSKSADEETWCKGAQYWAKIAKENNYNAKFGILLDMVSCANPSFAMEATSMYYAPDIMREVWQLASNLGFASVFVPQRTMPIIDDHLFINKILGIPTIDIIHHDFNTSTGFFPYWHTLNDNLENVDRDALGIVGKLLTEIVYREK